MNTFVTPNGELGFSLKEISEIIGIPILGGIYEEFFPIDSEFRGEDKFQALFFNSLHSSSTPRVPGKDQSALIGTHKVVLMSKSSLDVVSSKGKASSKRFENRATHLPLPDLTTSISFLVPILWKSWTGSTRIGQARKTSHLRHKLTE